MLARANNDSLLAYADHGRASLASADLLPEMDVF